MDSVFQKLEDIEMTAEAIVEHAEEEKAAIEKRLQEERDQFDAKLAEDILHGQADPDLLLRNYAA